MAVSIGDQVRHVGGGETGVVLRVDGRTAHVAFPQGKDYVPLEDLEAASDEPQVQLARGHFGDSTAAYLKLLAGIVRHAYAYDPTSALLNARLEPKLHQAFVAHRVVNKIAPRMILADEVGLGKTIEAGLVIKELRARKRVSRILVVTPASLSRQWQSELRTKFNESFDILDGPAAKHLGRGGKNPFEASNNVICSYQFATMGARPEQIIDVEWDLVVFDEAHRVRRTGTRSSTRRTTAAYRLADELRDRVDGMLLLSATPVQLHAYELFSLIDLVEPGLFASFEAFERVRDKLPRLNELMRALLRWETLGDTDKALALATSATLIRDLEIKLEDFESQAGRREVERQLTLRHPLADALIRNRKAHLGIQGKRVAQIRLVELSDAELEVHERVVEYLRDGYRLAVGQKNNAVGFLMVTYLKMLTSSSHALRTSLRRRIAALGRTLDGDAKAAKSVLKIDDDVWDAEEFSEVLPDFEGVSGHAERIQVEIEVLQELVAELDEIRDSKIRDLVELVRELDGQKVVLFTQFIETQLFLQKALEANGVLVGVFNGRMNADDKESAIREFRTRTQVLISTESGGEGRNLQFAHVLVNYDLPWNPMKVEQRIGRLDRIGQAEPVQIYNMVCAGTLDERIIEVLSDRIKLFEESVGALDPILGTVEKSIESLALAGSDDLGGFAEFSEDLAKKVTEARLLEQTMADFVLDQASFRKDEANELLGRNPMVSTAELAAVVEAGLDYLGGKVLPHEEGGQSITLSPRLASRMGVPAGFRGVFDPAEAVRMDDMDFFACGHVLVDRVLDSLEALPDADTGYRLSSHVPNGVWVEVIREITSRVGPGSGQLIRHLVGADGELASVLVTALPLDDEVSAGRAPNWAESAVRISEEFFRDEFEAFVSQAKVEFSSTQHARRERLERVYQSQRDRLSRQIEAEEAWLGARRVNPSDRDRKILPAREKKLELAKGRLVELKEELELEVERLMAEQPDIRARVVSASVVEGR